MAINYVDYMGVRYSIQAFTQLALSNTEFVKEGKKVDLSLDISRFASGRDEKPDKKPDKKPDTDCLEGFLKYISENSVNSFIKENVASISDGEILFTKLPDLPDDKFPKCSLTKVEGMILKKIFLEGIQREKRQCYCELKLDDKRSDFQDEVEKIKSVINGIKNKDHKIWKILKDAGFDKMSQMSEMSCNNLKKLNQYDGNKNDQGNNKYVAKIDVEYFETWKDCIACVWEEVK
jgi:hypothetical protein